MLNQSHIEIATESSAAQVCRQSIDTLRTFARSASGKFSREIASVPAEHRDQRCPSCHSIIYSRRHRLCGVCSEPLPESFLFSVVQARRVEQLLERERQDHRNWLDRHWTNL